MFDSKMYQEVFSSLHASEDTLDQVMKKAVRTGKMRRRLFPAFVVLLTLAISGAVFSGSARKSHGAWVFHGSRKEIEKMGVYCPEQLGPYRIDEQSADSLHMVSAGAGSLKAFFRPDYTWMSVSYEKNSRQSLSLSLGTMDHPLWADASGYDLENDIWNGRLYPETLTWYDEAQGSVSYVDHITEHTYQNCTIYLYDRITEYAGSADPAPPLTDYRDACAVWTDPEIGVWFGISPFCAVWEMDGDSYTYIREDEGVTKEEMLGYVKEIIDGCR